MKTGSARVSRLLLCSSLGLLGAALLACATTDAQALAKFRQGVSAVQTDSRRLFLEFNGFVRELQLDRAATLPNLKESDVAPGLDAESVGRWNAACEALSLYASSLESLTAPAGGAKVEESLRALGGRILQLAPAKGRDAARADALNGAIGHIGRLVVEAAARKRALQLAREADPSVRATLLLMADMIGGDATNGGLRTTLWSNWTLRADGLRVEFLEKGANKRKIAAAYAEALDGRGAGDAALGALHKALLDLADLHTAAAQGRAPEASEIAASLQREVAFATTLLEAAQKDQEKRGAPR